MLPKEYKLSKEAKLLINKNINRISYIKGHGGKFRLMTSEHSPIGNISGTDMYYLKHHNQVEVNGLVYKSLIDLPFL